MLSTTSGGREIESDSFDCRADDEHNGSDFVAISSVSFNSRVVFSLGRYDLTKYRSVQTRINGSFHPSPMNICNCYSYNEPGKLTGSESHYLCIITKLIIPTYFFHIFLTCSDASRGWLMNA